MRDDAAGEALHPSAVRVLLVEDEPADRALVRALLAGCDTMVLAAESPTLLGALDAIRAGGLDCVLLDLHLPDAIGMEAVQSLAAAAPDLPVVVLTELDSDETALEALGAGVHEYIVKGRLNRDLVIRAVRHSIERARVRSELARVVEDRTAALLALSASERRFRQAFETAPIGMALVDVHDWSGRIAEVNGTLLATLGRATQDVVGRTFATFVHPEDLVRVEELFANASKPQPDPIEVRLRPRRSEVAWGRIAVAPLSEVGRAPTQLLLQIEDVTERRRAQEQIAEYSFVDVLTRLPNRLLALDRIRQALARAQRSRSSVALLFLDLDRFKVVNDSLGHGVGDDVLRVVGARLPQAVRPEDTVARIGGDEFVICCEDLPADFEEAQAEAVRIAERIRAHLERPIGIEQAADLVLTISIGIALSSDHARTAEELLRDADAAVHRAKDNGRSRWELFDDALRAEAVGRLATERALRHAIDEVKLEVHYQPIVELPSGGVVGAEALLRWRHADGALAGPSDFIKIAEETGLIIPIGRWVLEQAVSTLERWGGRDTGMRMAINVSASQLLRSDLALAVADLCERYSVDPRQLTIEVTERQLVDLVGSGLTELRSLAALGVRISLDDFGTGYGSLTYLRTLPVDEVKIDRMFVAGMATSLMDRAIVESVARLAMTMGLDVIAEGVELEDDARLLVQIGCRHAQGWLFGRAVDADALLALPVRPPLTSA